MSSRWILVGLVGVGILCLAGVEGCANAPAHIEEPTALTNREFDESTPEGALGRFLSIAKGETRPDVVPVYRAKPVLNPPDEYGYDRRCVNGLRSLMGDPSVLRIEYVFRPAYRKSRRAVADLTLIRQNGKYRGTRPLEMVRMTDPSSRQERWVLDTGWNWALCAVNFTELIP